MQEAAAAERSAPIKRKREKSADTYDYSILWTNFPYVMERWGLSEDECYNCLLSVLGPSPESEAFEKKRKLRQAEEAAALGAVSDDGLDEDTLRGIIQEAEEESEEEKFKAEDCEIDPEKATVNAAEKPADLGLDSQDRVSACS